MWGLANHEGGDLVFGIEQDDDGAAKALWPITNEPFDDAERRPPCANMT